MNELQSSTNNDAPIKGSTDWGVSKNWLYKDLKIHFRVTGEESNPSIVLIHGFGASSDHWRNNAEVFASEGFRIYGIDLPRIDYLKILFSLEDFVLIFQTLLNLFRKF